MEYSENNLLFFFAQKTHLWVQLTDIGYIKIASLIQIPVPGVSVRYVMSKEQKKSHMYKKCPNISYTKVSDKLTYANSADPDQTAPEGAV